MPRYQFGRASLETFEKLTIDEARTRLEAHRADEVRRSEEGRRWAQTATPAEREGARLLAEKWLDDEPIGALFIGPPTTEIVLAETSWENGRILDRYNVGGYRAWAEPGLTLDQVRALIASRR